MGVSAKEAAHRLAQRLGERSVEDRTAEFNAKALLPGLARALKAAGATRIVLFGSLASGLFRSQSDIDIAVAGLPESTLARLERELTLEAHRPIELANLDAMPGPLRERVGQLGRDLR